MSYKVEVLPEFRAKLGEGPHWDVKTNSLYFVSYPGINRYDYGEQKFYSAEIEDEAQASFIIPLAGTNNRYVVALERRIAIIQWDGTSPKAAIEKIICELDNDSDETKTNRINDGKADPKGHLITGTLNSGFALGHRKGSLYSISKNGKTIRMRGDIGLSNGIAFNEKAGKMYYVDTMDYNVREFSYDFDKGIILDEGRVIVELNYGELFIAPDGMTIDNEGFLYVAIFGKSNVVKIDPRSNEVVLTIEFPCEQITSCAFGGPNHDILFATSGASEFTGTKTFPPEAGGIFKVTGLGAKGLPMHNVQLEL